MTRALPWLLTVGQVLLTVVLACISARNFGVMK